MPLPAYRSHNQYRDRSRSRVALLLSPSQRKQLFLLIGFCLIYSFSFFRLQPDRSYDQIQKWNSELKAKEKIRLEKRKKLKNRKQQRPHHPDEIVLEDEDGDEEQEPPVDVAEWERKMRQGGEGGVLSWRQEQEQLSGAKSDNNNGNYLRGDVGAKKEGEDESTSSNAKRKRRPHKRSSGEALVDFIVMMSIFSITRACLRICLYYRQFSHLIRDEEGRMASNRGVDGGGGASRSNSRGASLARMVVPQSVHAHAMLLRNAQLRTWVTQLNQERQQHGQPPLSLESLRLVLQNRDFGGNDYEALMRFHEEATIAQSMGATQVEIDRCPQRTITDPNDDLLVPLEHYHHTQGETAHNCAICLEMYQIGDRVRTLPCFHAMHVHCIDPWLRHRASCPVCKHPANGS